MTLCCFFSILSKLVLSLQLYKKANRTFVYQKQVCYDIYDVSELTYVVAKKSRNEQIYNSHITSLP